MDLIIDDNFRNTFAIYYKGQADMVVYRRVNEALTLYDPEIICDSINIIKTSATIGLTYSDCHNKIVAKVISKFPIDSDIDYFVLNLTIKVMIAMGSKSIEELLSKPRDIYREVTAKHFRVPETRVSKDMMNEVFQAAEKFTNKNYSIQEEPVGTWDEYFYNVCIQVGRNSKCLSRRIGAVLVKDKSIVSTGYNGPPRGVPRCDLRWAIDEDFNEKYGLFVENRPRDSVCPRKVIGSSSGENLEICLATHAEVNAVVNAARNGIKTKNTTLFLSCGIPCHNCMATIINSGIKEIVLTSLAIYDESSMYLLNQSKLMVRLFDFIK